jgi:hypothetical protein
MQWPASCAIIVPRKLMNVEEVPMPIDFEFTLIVPNGVPLLPGNPAEARKFP